MLDPTLDSSLNDAFAKLGEQEKNTIQTQYLSMKKETAPAYLLWGFLGWAMAHLFYLERKKEALLRLALVGLNLLFFVLFFTVENLFALVACGTLTPVLFAWGWVDLFRMSRILRQRDNKNAEELINTYGESLRRKKKSREMQKNAPDNPQ